MSISPLFASGFSLLGELGKFVRVSPVRFSSVAPTADGMAFSVRGAAGEQLSVAVAAGGVVRRVGLAFPDSGGGVQSVVCSGSGAAPCSVTDAKMV